MKPLVNIIQASSWWTSCSSFHRESHSVTETDSCVLCSLSLKSSKRSARKQSPTAELTQIWWHGSFQPRNIEHIRASGTCSALTNPSLHSLKRSSSGCHCAAVRELCQHAPQSEMHHQIAKTLWGQTVIFFSLISELDTQVTAKLWGWLTNRQ